MKRTSISQIPVEKDESGWSLKGSGATSEGTQTNYRVFWVEALGRSWRRGGVFMGADGGKGSFKRGNSINKGLVVEVLKWADSGEERGMGPRG